MHLFKPRKPNIDTAFLQYGDMVYRVALTHLGNDADAQDVVQDVFVKYLSNQPVFKDSNHEKAWLLRTAINRCIDLSRKQKIREYVPLDEMHNVAVDSQEGLNDLLMLVAQLPTNYKDVVILHSLEGFTIEETANILKISISATKMRLSRARDMLKTLRKE